MGKNKKGFNWKARQQPEVKVIEGSRIGFEIINGRRSNVIKRSSVSLAPCQIGDSNTVVLPSKKRLTVKKRSNESKLKFLSKRQRKMQEQLKEKRLKSSKRGDLIKAIQAVQASDEEMKQFLSITQMQTKGVKRYLQERKRAENDSKKPRLSEEEKAIVPQEDDDSSESDTDERSTPSRTRPNVSFPSLLEFPVTDEETEASELHKEGIVRVGPTRAVSEDPQDPISTEPKRNPFRRLQNVPVQRRPEVQEERLKLPVTAEEQAIMETISSHSIVVICGETGSGKTTQVPQFLYEAGYASGDGIIGVTEPRRVAAISMSKRVGIELNRPSQVSYQIRYEGNASKGTKIKFMTDGVLMREVASDFLLRRYSVIIIDEAHERSVFTDVLIGLLSRIVHLREKRGLPLKLIIMSATLRIEDFTENTVLFRVPPPIIKVDSRQYPVTIHFNRRTPSEKDCFQETFDKVCKIHRELPAGGILVFLTGQQEVNAFCKKLRHTFPQKKLSPAHDRSPCSDKKLSPRTTLRAKKSSMCADAVDTKADTGEHERTAADAFKLDAYPIIALDEEESKAEVDADEAEDSFTACGESSADPMFVLPLYSLLPTERQALVFQRAPPGCRLCIVATNVAETSLTIPDIKYVVDTGKTKMKLYDENTGLSTFRVMWTSKASANQRAGRAGRTSQGHCYRMYSSAVFNEDFLQFTAPEITRRPIEDLVLQMKAMNIEKVANFPFPTPPSRDALAVAEKELVMLGALEKTMEGRKNNDQELVTRITELGRTMSCFPVAPRFAKMLSLSAQYNLTSYFVALIAALTVQEPILEGRMEDAANEPTEEVKQKTAFLDQLKKRWIGTGFSRMLGDLMVLLRAVGSAESQDLSAEYCLEHSLRLKAMLEIRQLRQQLTNAINLTIPGLNCIFDSHMPPPDELQCKMILQIALCCMGRKVARKVPAAVVAAADPVEKPKLRHAYQTLMLEQLVYIHPNSVLYRESPEFILYQDLFEGNKIYCRNVIQIEPAWIAKFLPDECVFSAPMESTEPRFDEGSGKIMCSRTSCFGPHGWPLPAVEVPYPPGLDAFRWFGRRFLEGLVCSKMGCLLEHLFVNPAVMVKSWANLQPRTQSLLQALADKNVGCKEELLKVWIVDKKYLLREYLQWLPEAYRTQASRFWPPL